MFLTCSQCKQGFLREAFLQKQRRKHKDSKGKLQFCTKKCQGVWLGSNHGGSNKKVSE